MCGATQTRRFDLSRHQATSKCNRSQPLTLTTSTEAVKAEHIELEVTTEKAGEMPGTSADQIEVSVTTAEYVPAEVQTVKEGSLSRFSFTTTAPEGVEIGSSQFYEFISAAVEVATNDFDVCSPQEAQIKFSPRQLQHSSPAVLRQCASLLTGLTIPADILTFREVLEGVPESRKINVCFSSLQEVEDAFTLKDFLTHNEDQALEPRYHPMNIIDLDIETHQRKMAHQFSLPDIVKDLSFGHRMGAALAPALKTRFDFTSGISNYLLMSEAGSQTNWHQDFTGTSVFYVVVKGSKHFYIVEPTEQHQKLFDEWQQSDLKTLV